MYLNEIKRVSMNGEYYRVLYQNESDYRKGLIDILCIRSSDHHYVRFIGFNPKNNDYDSKKDFGALGSADAHVVKRDFFYASYKC